MRRGHRFQCPEQKLIWNRNQGVDRRTSIGNVNPRQGQRGLHRGLSFILAFIFFPACRCFFALADTLRLEQMQGQRYSDMKSFPAQSATYWKLQQSQPGNIRKTHPRCPELWSTAVRAIHIQTRPFTSVFRLSHWLRFNHCLKQSLPSYTVARFQLTIQSAKR